MKISIKDITIIAMMVAIIEVCKISLSFLPNIELTTFWLIIFTLYFGRKILCIVPVFIVIEIAIYGLQLWVVMHLFAWSLLVIITYVFKKCKSVWFWSIFSGSFGLLFGALCTIPYVINAAFSSGLATGINLGIAWWIAGIPFDVTHCMGNFCFMLILYKPITNILVKYKLNSW